MNLTIRRGLQVPPWAGLESGLLGHGRGLCLYSCVILALSSVESSLSHVCHPQVVVLNGCASLFSALATVLCEVGGK